MQHSHAPPLARVNSHSFTTPSSSILYTSNTSGSSSSSSKPHATRSTSSLPTPASSDIFYSSSSSASSYADPWAADDSDTEDVLPSTSRGAMPIPAPRRPPLKVGSGKSESAAFSYTHVTAPSPESYRAASPGTASNGGRAAAHRESPSKDGGAWEIVREDGETVESEETAAPKMKEGKEAVRPDALELVEDPFRALSSMNLLLPPKLARPSRAASSPGDSDSPEKPIGPVTDSLLRRTGSVRTERKRERFANILAGGEDGDVEMSELRRLSWSGIPPELRPIVWQLLLAYTPSTCSRRLPTLQRKRAEYASAVALAFDPTRARDGPIWHQISIDVPRTNPGNRLWQFESTQRALERILYVWAIRHPASGYVQGINDLATPFFEVFLSAYIDSDPEIFDPSHLPPQVLQAVEADTFWCLSKLLDGIQDNYIHSQPGIQRQVRRMRELTSRIDAPLAAHLEAQGVEFIQFAFRWVNCLLMREMSVKNVIRMWDTYLAEGTDAFSHFHLYVCSAFLVKWSQQLQGMDFQGIIMFLQSLPTQDWGDHEIELLLSEAFVLKSVWQHAQNHFLDR